MRARRSKERMAKYPNDRIPFRKDMSVAVHDRKAFSSYSLGLITIENLCRKLAENNNLPSVTREQALNEWKICGWAGGEE